MEDQIDVKKVLSNSFSRWIQILGLLWWDITIVYYDDPVEIVSRFREDENGIVAAKTYADWRYGSAKIIVNLTALNELSTDQIDRLALHELVHILVNEMRWEGIDHEERVVTGLVKAFRWVSEEDLQC